MSPPDSKRKLPGRRAVRLAFLIAGAILLGTVLGEIVSSLRALIYVSAGFRYSLAGCLLAVFAWLLRRIIRTWNDPYAQWMKWASFLPPLAALLLAAGVLSVRTHVYKAEMPPDVDAALRQPASVTLYSIDPGHRLPLDDSGKEREDTDATFHGYPILGQVALDGEKAARAAAAFRAAFDLEAHDYRRMAMCFNPRHGLRVSYEGHVYDFVLCYQCIHIDVYRDKTMVFSGNAVGTPDALNALLTEAKIPLAPH